MNRWEAAVIVVALLILGWFIAARYQSEQLSEYIGFGNELVLGIFAVGAVTVVVGLTIKSRRKRRW